MLCVKAWQFIAVTVNALSKSLLSKVKDEKQNFKKYIPFI